MWSLVQQGRLRKQTEIQCDRNRQSTSHTTRDENAEKPQCERGGKIYVKTIGDNDPMDPRNWPLLDRSKNIAILALLIFVQAWAGGAESMANSSASAEMGHSQVAESLSIAMYLFGIGVGALLTGPISETVGRNATYLVSTFCYLFFVLGAALAPTFGARLVCRFLMALFASATLTINGSSVKDQFRPVKRAFVFPVIAWANLAGEFPPSVVCIMTTTCFHTLG